MPHFISLLVGRFRKVHSLSDAAREPEVKRSIYHVEPALVPPAHTHTQGVEHTNAEGLQGPVVPIPSTKILNVKRLELTAKMIVTGCPSLCIHHPLVVRSP